MGMGPSSKISASSNLGRLATFPTSVHYDRPTVDGDMMGRAYPSMEHGK